MSKRSSIVYTPTDLENIHILVRHGYARNTTQAVSMALAMSAKKIAPAYMSQKNSLTEDERLVSSVDKQVVREMKRKEIKTAKEEKIFQSICKTVDGKITSNEFGDRVCRYNVYNGTSNINGPYVEKWEQEFAPANAGEYIVTDQYRTITKQEAQKLIKDGKVKEI